MDNNKKMNERTRKKKKWCTRDHTISQNDSNVSVQNYIHAQRRGGKKAHTTFKRMKKNQQITKTLRHRLRRSTTDGTRE